MTISGKFLVLDDEEVWRRLVAHVLTPFGDVYVAESLAEATEVFAKQRAWAGIVTDIEMGDGSGLDFLQTVRRQGATMPVLVLTAHQDARRINRARALSAEFLCKPAEPESLAGFARRAIALHWTRSERVARRIDTFAVEHRLTPRESELVSAAVAGMPRRLVAEELCVSENTLKAQIRLLLVKCRTPDLDDLSNEILKQALEGAALSRTARSAE